MAPFGTLRALFVSTVILDIASAIPGKFLQLSSFQGNMQHLKCNVYVPVFLPHKLSLYTINTTQGSFYDT